MRRAEAVRLDDLVIPPRPPLPPSVPGSDDGDLEAHDPPDDGDVTDGDPVDGEKATPRESSDEGPVDIDAGDERDLDDLDADDLPLADGDGDEHLLVDDEPTPLAEVIDDEDEDGDRDEDDIVRAASDDTVLDDDPTVQDDATPEAAGSPEEGTAAVEDDTALEEDPAPEEDPSVEEDSSPVADPLLLVADPGDAASGDIDESTDTDLPTDPDATDPDEPTGVDDASGAAAVTDIVASVLADDEPAADSALALRGVTKVFGQTRAVDGIDLTVPAGTFYGLVGPNGAGKTTTLSMIAGLLQPDRGAISVNGVDAISDPVHAKSMMGVLPDRLRTFDRLTGRQLLYYYGVLRGLSPSVVESRTADLARAFDLTDALGRVVSDYSVGMSKKVMLAGALIHSPRVLVLDEPFESVDPVSSSVILDILGTYVEHGGTVILSSHGMDLVERVCSRVAVIVAGQVLAEGTIDEVRGELTLEQRFVELAGGLSDVEGLEWLHTFSD